MFSTQSGSESSHSSGRPRDRYDKINKQDEPQNQLSTKDLKPLLIDRSGLEFRDLHIPMIVNRKGGDLGLNI